MKFHRSHSFNKSFFQNLGSSNISCLTIFHQLKEILPEKKYLAEGYPREFETALAGPMFDIETPQIYAVPSQLFDLVFLFPWSS